MKAYPLINELLAKKEEYTKNSWDNIPLFQGRLMRLECILRDLKEAALLPDIAHDELALWLMHNSPLTEFERGIVHHFLYQIDYY